MTLAKSLFTHRSLLIALARRDIQSGFKGSILGTGWLILYPIVYLSLYAFVFETIFGASRLSAENNTADQPPYFLSLFIGLIIYFAFSEVLTRSIGLIQGNVNYVKKIAFPLEILSPAAICAALVRTLISFGIWILSYALFVGVPPATTPLFLLLLVPLILLCLGTSWLISALAVYFRDLAQLVTLLSTGILFLSAIFYPLEAVPEPYQSVLLINPIAQLVDQAREVTLRGNGLNIELMLYLTTATLAFAYGSYRTFEFTRRGFADVL